MKQPVFAALLLLVGCSSTPITPQASNVPARPQTKILIEQASVSNRIEFVACAETSCRGRTTKVIATQAPAAPIPKPAIAPAPQVPQARHVYFQWGSSRLSAEALAVIREIVPAAKRAERIIIKGGTDPTGGAAANRRLALKRARVVKHELVSLGVEAAAIDAKRHEPCCEATPFPAGTAHAAMRRADVEIELHVETSK